MITLTHELESNIHNSSRVLKLALTQNVNGQLQNLASEQ